MADPCPVSVPSLLARLPPARTHGRFYLVFVQGINEVIILYTI